MFSNNLALGLFFLYFVLMSGECAELMNCGLQKYINNNIFIKHLMIFLSIFIFTFILNWYTIDNIVEVKLPDKLISSAKAEEGFEEGADKEKNKTTRGNRFDYLLKSFYYSVAIYLIFVLSTKNAGGYSFIFLLGMVAIVFGTILVKTINADIAAEISDGAIFTFVSPAKMRALQEKYKDTGNDVAYITLIQNIMTTSAVALLAILCVGAYQYYLRQYEDYADNWSWLKFWFGTNSCSNL